jgi:carboxypeptidase C (cathepsin A)
MIEYKRIFGLLPISVLWTALLLSTTGIIVQASESHSSSQSTQKEPELPTPSDFLVQGLDEVIPAFAEFEGEMYAGQLPMDHEDRSGGGKFQFWLFAPHEPLAPKTLTIWLNGGPGCTSFSAGNFFEHGAVTIPLRPAGECCATPNEPLVPNPHSWTKATHMLYVEQPIGVGFSTPGTIPPPHNETDVAADFFAFLQNFYRVFEHYHDYELYVSGESYAGIYVPSIAYKIYTEMKELQKSHKSKKHSKELVPIHLGGIAIGNGLLNSNVQGPIRIDWAYYHGLIDMHTRDQLNQAWDTCIQEYNQGSTTTSLDPPFHPFNLPDDCGMLAAIPLVVGKDGLGRSMQVYDVTTRDPYDVLRSVDSVIGRFYNHPMIKEKLHAPQEVIWRGCIPGAGRRRLQEEENSSSYHRQLASTFLRDDRPLSVIPYIAEMLDGGVRAMFYNGDRDMAGNPAGTEQLLNAMEWHGASEWYTTSRGLWLMEGEVAGFAKSLDNLLFVVVYNSGHLVPYNQPGPALDLITRFLKNESFYDSLIPTLNVTVPKGKSKSSSNVDPVELESILRVSRVNGETGSRNERQKTLLPLLLSFLLGIGVTSLWHRWQRRAFGYESI